MSDLLDHLGDEIADAIRDPSRLANQRWRRRAACADINPDLFYPKSRRQERKAKAVCARCPVRKPCLIESVANQDGHGVWGGTNPDEREAMFVAAKRRIFATRFGGLGEPV